MCLVNCCVVNRSTSKTVFPWSILSTGESGVTVKQFYEEKVVNKLNVPEEVELEAAFLGKSKESLDKIELSLSLDSAIPLFGPFLRYHTHGHYKVFKDLLGTKTDGSHRPSLQRVSKRTKTLPFAASVQHVKNVDVMLQCDECCMWRLLYCRFKLTKKERSDLQTALEDISFTCGAQLQDLELPGRLNDVYTRIISCEQPIEKLYYSAKYSPVCVYCAQDVESIPEDKYPQCVDCVDKPAILKV